MREEGVTSVMRARGRGYIGGVGLKEGREAITRR